MGMKSWVTQGSKDDGVDGVAINPGPIVGGLCIIQAKRWSNIVGLEAVHVLVGVMDDKSAAKGVLVATSWVG
ncbi:MAG TPA: restriction endonuclease, partial [Mycobacterium sp.]|nr:restriction endonuclease [Mycobacterium sp.]